MHLCTLFSRWELRASRPSPKEATSQCRRKVRRRHLVCVRNPGGSADWPVNPGPKRWPPFLEKEEKEHL